MLRRAKSSLFRCIKLLYNIVVFRLHVGFIDSIEKWARNKESKKLIFESRPTVWYKTAVKGDELVNFDRRFCRRAEFRLFNDIRWCLCSEVKIYYLGGAFIVGEDATVMSPKGQIFKQLTYPTNGRAWRYGDFLGRAFLPAVSYRSGWYTTLVSPAAYNFFHWIMECLPRLAILGKYLQLCDGIIIPAGSRPFHYESLNALGLDNSRLIETSSRLHLKAEHLFATDYSARDNPPLWLHRWYKERVILPLGLKVTPGRRIYISRADAVHRKASNLEEIEKMISKLGFEIIVLSKFSFLEQAAVFYTADIIVGEHGAGLTNLVFCRQGTKVIEILSPYWMYPCFYALATSAELVYHFHVAGLEQICSSYMERMASASTQSLADWDRSSTYSIDVDKLEKQIMEVMRFNAKTLACHSRGSEMPSQRDSHISTEF